MRAVLIAFCLWAPVHSLAQSHMNEAAAKEAVYRIVRHSGLSPDFLVREDPQVHTAVAYIKGHDRVIAYNADFISSVLDSTGTSWAAVSILAHEIAHHLLGHTLDPGALHPGDELACDRYSGFILQRMGASLPDALASIEVAGDAHGTMHHPPRHARSEAITQGWEEAERLSRGIPEAPITIDRGFQFVVKLTGDKNTYYVDAEGCLVWFNDHSEPIEFGACTRLPDGDYVYELTWQNEVFVVDGKNAIWRRSTHGMPLPVGSIDVFAARGVPPSGRK